ncbi:unnamed protein product [Closterium sp. NIES-54]
MLESFGLSKANPVHTPLPTGFDVHAHAEEPLLRDELVQLYQSIVGSLMYASTTTQPQIAYAVSQLSKVVSCPKAFHLQAAERVLRYLKGCVFYPAHSKPQVELVGFSDADYARDSADHKSHTGYVYCLNGAAISWQSKRQPVVALSTTESEYISLCQCIQEGVWLKRLFEEFGHDFAGGVPVFVDNQSAIALAQNACLHGRTKHMQVRWHFIREMAASSEEIGIMMQQGARTNQGSLLKDVLRNFSVEKFNGDGYDDWSWKMQLYFRQIGLLKLMTGVEKRPLDASLQADWDERSSVGYYLLS